MRLEWIWERRSRGWVLLASVVLTLVIALVEWRIAPYVSLGFLSLFPMILAAGFVFRWTLALPGYAVLSEECSRLDESFVRSSFGTLALAGRGLFVAQRVRSRRLNAEAQERFKTLVESSPAAIVTVDERGSSSFPMRQNCSYTRRVSSALSDCGSGVKSKKRNYPILPTVQGLGAETVRFNLVNTHNLNREKHL